MAKRKCHGCGVVDNVGIGRSEFGKLKFAFAPPDNDGMPMYHVYCRSCNALNFYKRSLLGYIKFDSILIISDLLEAYKNGEISHQEMGFISGTIQEAMIEDGILPKDWELV